MGDGKRVGTSVVRILFAFPLLAAARRIRARTPVGVHLHVQLALASRQFVVFGLFLATQSVPLCCWFVCKLVGFGGWLVGGSAIVVVVVGDGGWSETDRER